jgi:hypothetical protein
MEMSEEARKAKNAYQREYRRKNLDKIRKINNTYWERKALRDVTGKNSVTDASVTSVTSVTPDSFPAAAVVADGKRCLECGKIFEPKRLDAKFCSAACKQRNYRKEH